MSFRAMIWAWEVDGLTSATKLVLLALAQHANEDGNNSYPSVATVAAECRMSERTVQGALKALETEGYITVVRRLRQTSMFSLRMDLKVVAKRERAPARNPAESAPSHPAESAPLNPAESAGTTPQNLQFNPADSAPEPVQQPVRNEPADASACAGAGEAAEGAAFDALFGIAPPAPPPAPPPPVRGPVRATPQQPAPPGWRLPHNPYPTQVNFPPIPPEPAGDPQRWMPRLSDPEHRWAILAPGEEIDPHSMTGARRQCRGAWILRDIAGKVAEAMGWYDQRRYTDWRPLCAWLDDGLDPHDTILPAIRRVVERRGNVEISTLAYFDKAVREAAGSRRRA
jgi:hypothetical protein